jgi:ubiquitin carboxyl-terminal hydrolase 7
MDRSIDSLKDMQDVEEVDQVLEKENNDDLFSENINNNITVGNNDPNDPGDITDNSSSGPLVVDSNEEELAANIDTDQIDWKKPPEVDFDANLKEMLEDAPIGLDSITGYHTFKIRNLSDMLIEKERFKGPKFQVGNYVFNLILVCQKRTHFFFSVYLEGHPINEKQPEGDDEEPEVWSFPVQFTFDAWDPENPNYHKNNNTRFRFNQRVTDWGFVQFLDSRSALDNKFFKTNQVNITVYLRVIDDYTNVLYSDFRDYDSKKYTGYVGIENQGATCYLNSLLQSYFFTKSFRKKVYQIPTEDEISLDYDSYEEYKKQSKSVSLALQRIFYKLQTSDSAINSLELTHSFGWTTADAFTQHDVQELNRILMDRLENKMKGTEIDGCLNNIFVGKMSSFIRCINVDYESSRTEDFWDIQLNVKGLKNIQESFENYVELELMDGDNKYDASGFGLQDAEKGVIFENFPDVLHIQLKRYEYDFETDNMVKIHDRYEFFSEIDLKPYISKNSETFNGDWNYKLHGVLVHQGDVSVGHYYAMIKPTHEDKWFKFDDDRVTRVTLESVFEEGFGCGPPVNINRQMSRDEYQNYIIKHHTSAYMLVYIRESKIPDVLAKVEESDIPEHIPKQIEYENQQEMIIKKEKEEMHLFVNFKIYNDKTFNNYEGFDIGPDEDSKNFNEELFAENSLPIRFRLLKTDLWSSIYEGLSELLDINASNIDKLRLWNIVKRTNDTFRPDRPIDSFVENIEEATIGDIASILENGVSRRKYNGMDKPIVLSLYLEDASKDLKYLANHSNEIIPTGNFDQDFQKLIHLAESKIDATLEPIIGTPNILLFIKYFSDENQQITGLSHIIVPNSATTEFLSEILQPLLKFTDEESLSFYEEYNSMKRLEVKPDTSFYKNEIGNGDIICFGIENSKINKELQYQNLEDRYIFLESRVHFQFLQLKRVDEDEEDYVFIDTNEKAANYDKIIDVWLSYYSSYLDIATVIGKEINVSPEYIKLSFISNGNKVDLKSDYDFKSALCNISKQSTIILYFEVLNIPLQQFEGMELYHIYWVTNGICKEERHDFYLPRSSTIDQITNKLQSKLDIQGDIRDDVFCWIPDHHHKIKKILSLDDTLDNGGFLIIGMFPQFKEIYTSKNKDAFIVSGLQCYAALENRHGLPFIFDIIKGELIPETLERLRKLLGLSEKEFKVARIGLTNFSNPIDYIDPVTHANVELFSECSRNVAIVVDHPDRKSRRASQHSSIMIKN